MFIFISATLFFVCWLFELRLDFINDNNIVFYWTNVISKQRHNYIF